MPQNMATASVGVSGNGKPKNSGNGGLQATVGFGWPTERWVALIVLLALGLLILIRVGFRGVGVQGNVGARLNL